MDYTKNKKSIKYHVCKFLKQNAKEISGKTIIDIPAGNGVTSSFMKDLGGNVRPFDLFPEYFKSPELSCQQADVMKGIPVADQSSDWVICQEGIEHFQNQHVAFKEFNRILKNDGILIVTTPNYSNIGSKFSFMMGEMERFNKTMPMNEMDSVWMNTTKKSQETYFGHVFLIGIIKLRLLAVLNGFEIEHIVFTRTQFTSLLLMPVFYPIILLFNVYTYLKNKKKAKTKQQKESYKKVFRLNINPKILIDKHLFVVFKKKGSLEEAFLQMEAVHKEFGIT